MRYSSIGRWVRSRHGISTVVVTAVALAVEARWGLRPTTVLATPAAAAVATAVLALWWDGRTVPETPSFAKPRAGADTRALREDPNAQIVTDRGGYLFARRHWFVGTGCPPVRLRPELAAAARGSDAVKLAETDTRAYWAVDGRFWWENQGLEARDVLALTRDKDRRRQRGLERAHLLLDVEATAETRRRAPIPADVRRAVWERDGGRCVECGSSFGIQYDHVIPWTLGGADTVENLQILCSTCNQTKGATV